MSAFLRDHWRLILVGGTGLVVLLLARRVPRWMVGAWALLGVAVGGAWLLDMSWLGTAAVFAGLVLIASAYWLRGEERAADRVDSNA